MRIVARQYTRVQPASWAAAFGGGVLINAIALAWLTGFGHGFGGGGFGAAKLGDPAQLADCRRSRAQDRLRRRRAARRERALHAVLRAMARDTDACLDESYQRHVDRSVVVRRARRQGRRTGRDGRAEAGGEDQIDRSRAAARGDEATGGGEAEVVPMQPAQPAAAPPPPPPSPPHRLQIVETVKPQTETAARSRGVRQRVRHQREEADVARGTAKEPMVARSKPGGAHAQGEPAGRVGQGAHRSRARSQHEGARRAGHARDAHAWRANPGDVQQDQARAASTPAPRAATADGYMMRRGDGAIDQQKHDRIEVPHGENGAGGARPTCRMKPTQEVLERVLGGGTSITWTMSTAATRPR